MQKSLRREQEYGDKVEVSSSESSEEDGGAGQKKSVEEFWKEKQGSS